MTGTFLIIYIIGAIASVICSCTYVYWKCDEITLGDIIFSLILSIGSWVSLFVFVIVALLAVTDTIVIFKKKNK